MSMYFWLLALTAIGSLSANILKVENQFEDDSENCFSCGKKWVVLVSGSADWDNYRHQADICHAYQIIHKQNGIPKENIITMMVDDIQDHYYNPTKGKIINQPNGTNVYEGVVIDYRGSDVTVNNFINVITGNKKAMKDIGSGKVVNGGPHDNIFINFVDHGSTGLLGFPDDILFADQLNNALEYMYKNRLYSKVLMYIEACQSGSMFDGILKDNINVLAITAAGPRESSYGCYCDEESKPYYTCLGDLFSVIWMEDLENITDNKRSIFKDFASVRFNVTYSNVMIYGDFNVGNKKLAAFIGQPKTTVKNQPAKQKSDVIEKKLTVSKNSRDINANEIRHRLANISSWEQQNLAMKLHMNNQMKLVIDNVFRDIHSLITMMKPKIKDIIGEFDKPNHLELSLDMFPCYRNIIDNISKSCFSIPRNTYSFKRLNIIANLCVADKNIHEMVGDLISETCLSIPKNIINIH